MFKINYTDDEMLFVIIKLIKFIFFYKFDLFENFIIYDIPTN